MDKPCAKCSSNKIIPNAIVIDRGDYNAESNLSVAIDGDPNALFFKERSRFPVKAKVCGDCGFTEFYVENPASIYVAFQNQQNNLKNK